MLPNAYLDHTRARFAVAFLRDCAVAGQFDPSQPVYVLETGPASGRFGYSLHRTLTAILDPLSLSGVQVKLVLMDPDETQRTRWNEHIRLKPLAQAGLFDFANPDTGHEAGLRLELSGQTLSRGNGAGGNSFVNPVIVTAVPGIDLSRLRRICGDRLLLLFREPVKAEMLAALSAETGGIWLACGDFGVLCLLSGVDLRETRLAFGEEFEGCHPVDFEALNGSDTLTIRQYLVMLRLSNYDAEVACAQAEPVAALIAKAADELPAEVRLEIRRAIRKAWNGYYPDGESSDVPRSLAWVITAVRDWELAFELLDASLALHGESAERAFLMALSHLHRDEVESASKFVEVALQSNPEQEEYLWLRGAIAEKRQQLLELQYEPLLEIAVKEAPCQPAFLEAAKVLDPLIAPKGYPARDPDPGPPKRLTIGMATYDDYDGVYFSVMAIRLFHPEVTERTEILVIDNQPEGRASAPLRDLANWVKGFRYIPAQRPGGTASRDLVFRHANAEFVLCMDSHVLFEPGSLAALLDYLEAHPDTRNLFQGPILYDDLSTTSTHWDPNWRAGMWGTWGNDKRGVDKSAPPFEIPLQGLGVFACRREAWLGFNPRFRGFGGEEGYLHEKYRKAGAATLCLPFLRWVHRFARPSGPSYSPTFRDRVRNYLLGFHELGLDSEPVIRHFEELIGAAETRQAVEAIQKEIENPFYFFDGIYCINLDGRQQRWEQTMEQCRKVGIADLVLRFPGVETPRNPHIGCALSHRAVIAEARRRGLRNVLILEDDVVFAPDTIEVLAKNLAELRETIGIHSWQLLYLGGIFQRRKFKKAPGCEHLELSWVTALHAVAYSEAVYDRILRDVPDNPTGMAVWLRELWLGIDWYLMYTFAGSALIVSPVIASQHCLLSREQRSFEWDAS